MRYVGVSMVTHRTITVIIRMYKLWSKCKDYWWSSWCNSNYRAVINTYLFSPLLLLWSVYQLLYINVKLCTTRGGTTWLKGHINFIAKCYIGFGSGLSGARPDFWDYSRIILGGTSLVNTALEQLWQNGMLIEIPSEKIFYSCFHEGCPP